MHHQYTYTAGMVYVVESDLVSTVAVYADVSSVECDEEFYYQPGGRLTAFVDWLVELQPL